LTRVLELAPQTQIANSEPVIQRTRTRSMREWSRGDEGVERTLGSMQSEIIGAAEIACKHDRVTALSLLCQVEEVLQTIVPQGFSRKLLLQLQLAFKLMIEKFVDEQIQAISEHKSGTKRVGVVPIVARLPTLFHLMLQALLNGPPQAKAIEILVKAHENLLCSILQWLVNVGSSDPKHRDVFLFENANRLSRSFRALRASWVEAMASSPLNAGGNDEVSQGLLLCLDQTLSMRDTHLKAYVMSVANYKAQKLLELIETMERVMQQTGAAEVPYYAGLSLHTIVACVKETFGQPEKTAHGLHKRLFKHLSKSEGSVNEVWKHVADLLCKRYEKLQEMVTACYKAVLDPSPATISRIMQVPPTQAE